MPEPAWESTVAASPPEGTSLIEEILTSSGIPSQAPERADAREGLGLLLQELLKPGREGEPIDRPLVDAMIAEVTERLSRQIDEILHHPDFQKLEAAWRGLKFVVDRVEFRENIRLEMVNCSKEDLLMDFEDAPEIPKSGMYKLAYSAEFGQFGGKPYGLIVAGYEFGPTPRDLALLAQCAAVATMAHAPFFAAASPRFFGMDEFLGLPSLRDVSAMFEGPQYTKWQAFRATEDARYVGLVLPRFLLRLPYGAATVPVQAFNFEEDVVGSHGKYLWGNPAFALATRVAESFARYRWCPHIIGPEGGGTVADLPLHQYEAMGHVQCKIPTEIMLTERREWELSVEGFIGLVYRRDTDGACFFSANSVQKLKTFPRTEEGRQAELNYRLGSQIPYLFVACRIAHYIKVMQREQIGSWKERSDLERELNRWVGQYVADQEVVSASVRARRPLRKAQISVTEIPGNAGWYKVDVRLRPHFKYMGAMFSLDLVGKLDRE
ncbi:MAG: type VI secretion system contractile sheath large subunit [Deltaproteobacteria bacterium]|nr:type VI secretion system contractile sheath large subunit [Deltaproteobacteria bacterium]